jgi:alkanesulfonate monooxygenase SsuD/methylene tetrahydromethanopterin reductase-like flavin-dependent oxidoreductase (luciferase family)
VNSGSKDDRISNSVGVLVGTLLGPEMMCEIAVKSENLGFDSVWASEDYFYTGAISAASSLLSSTQHVSVGTGVVAGSVRHPAVLAMEISTLARMYPGRFIPGIGLGVPGRLHQMGLDPKSPLTSIRESINVLRALLSGEVVTIQSSMYRCDNIQLHYPTDESLPIYMGAFGPKMLRLSAEIADGTVIGFLTSRNYVKWASEQLMKTDINADRSKHHPLVVFVFFSVDYKSRPTKKAVRRLIAEYLFGGISKGLNAKYDAVGIADQLEEMAGRGGVDVIEKEMPDQWIEELAVVGDPEECAEKLSGYYRAGADSVVLMPLPPGRATQVLELAAEEVLPRIQ